MESVKTQPLFSNTGAAGPVGYSLLYGAWTGSWTPGSPAFPSSVVLPERATTLWAWRSVPLWEALLTEGRRRSAPSIGCKARDTPVSRIVLSIRRGAGCRASPPHDTTDPGRS